MLTIIIPTLNEAANIADALAAVRARSPDAEIIVVDGGSDDQTATLAAPFAQVIESRRGRARQMNAGAAHAQGEALLFLHADTRLAYGAAETIAAALSAPDSVGGGFALRFDQPGMIYQVIARSTNLRSRMRRIYTGDQAIFVRTSVFRAIGGFADIPLMEDLEIWQRLHQVGEIVLLTPPVLVSARRHRKYGPLRVLATGWLYQILYAFGLPPFALHRLYYGKVPE